MKPRPRKRTRSFVAARSGDCSTDKRVTFAVAVAVLAAFSLSVTRSENTRWPSSTNGACDRAVEDAGVVRSRGSVRSGLQDVVDVDVDGFDSGVKPAPSMTTNSRIVGVATT